MVRYEKWELYVFHHLILTILCVMLCASQNTTSNIYFNGIKQWIVIHSRWPYENSPDILSIQANIEFKYEISMGSDCTYARITWHICWLLPYSQFRWLLLRRGEWDGWLAYDSTLFHYVTVIGFLNRRKSHTERERKKNVAQKSHEWALDIICEYFFLFFDHWSLWKLSFLISFAYLMLFHAKREGWVKERERESEISNRKFRSFIWNEWWKKKAYKVLISDNSISILLRSSAVPSMYNK